MQKRRISALLGATLLVATIWSGPTTKAQAQGEKALYSAMAPIDQYLMPRDSEIALARTAAPPSISNEAEVMVLGRDGFTTAETGTNGFLCIVERGWGAATSFGEFWNPKIRAPICFNPTAAKTFTPIFLMKTKMVLAQKSKTEIAGAVKAAFDSGKLPALGPGAMSYMTSKQQYLNDGATNWHPHVMFYAPWGAAKTWGANLQASPVIADEDPEERVTILMIWADKWSDGTPAPQMAH